MSAKPQQHAVLAKYADRLHDARHGTKGKIMGELSQELGVTPRAAHRLLEDHTVRDRKRRSDAGDVALTEHEARVVSAAMMETTSGHGKQRGSLTDLVEQLRRAGMIRAERVVTSTGEVVALSDTAIARALRAYYVHPEQLRRPTPHVHLSSPHPNHTWQVDASVCVVFYLPTGGVGIYELKDGVHYKNKPGNLRAIEAFRVIRYVVTDHCSNVIRWRYYPHAESGQHTVRFLAWSMGRERAGNDPFHGAPLHLMVDPGATAAGLVKRFCKRLDIDLIVNKPGNARAKGSVEKGQDIIECKFESGLKFVRDEVRTFDDLNRLADLYQLHFNATAKHSRHGKARTDKWLEIRPDQLRTTPTETVLLSLATDEPESRTVSGDLSINFKARVWNVADVPNVTRGGKIAVHWHPFIPDTAMAVITDADGREHHLPLPEITKDEHGFPSTAAVIRSGYDAHADTVLETNRKAVKMLAAGASKITEAEAVSKGPSYTPFNGTFDPYVAAREETPPTVIPRIGNALDVGVPVVHAAKLSVTMAALQLQDRLGDAWRPDYFAWLERRFPDGVEEDQIDRLASQWSGSNTERRLQAC